MMLSRLTKTSWALIVAYFCFFVLASWYFYLPYSAERHYRDGFNFDVMKRYRFAIEEYQMAVEEAPWETQYIMELSKAYAGLAEQLSDKNEKIEMLKKSEELAIRMIELDDKNPWYKNRLANTYLSLAEIDSANSTRYLTLSEKFTREAAQVDSKNPLFQLNLAYFLHRFGLFDEAMELYYKVLSMDPRMVEARYNLADIYRRKGNQQEVLNQYFKAAQAMPTFPNIYLAIAGCYVQMNKPDLAAFYLEKEVQNQPTNADVIKNLAALYFQHNKYADSARVYELYFNLVPSNPDLFSFYIKSLVLSNQHEKAKTVFFKFQDYYFNNPAVLSLKKTYSL